jgi:hypothetical protein
MVQSGHTSLSVNQIKERVMILRTSAEKQFYKMKIMVKTGNQTPLVTDEN